MAAIRNRSEDNKSRKGRLAKQKKGPGFFRFKGSVDVELIPTFLLHGRNEPVFDASGMPVIDSSGRQIYQRTGSIVRDEKGQPMLGGVPKRVDHHVDEIDIRGVHFVKGVPVEVKSYELAMKLRGMDCFEEVEPDAENEAPAEEPPKRKRGRPRKVEEQAADAETAVPVEQWDRKEG